MSAFEIGVLVPLSVEENTLATAAEFGFETCQLCCWEPAIYGAELAAKVRKQAANSGMSVAALWGGWSVPGVWDFLQGPKTLGIVPKEYRAQRVQELKQAAEFASQIGAPAMITHLGFLPEDPNDPVYEEVVATVDDIAAVCSNLGIGFWFETGQETPVTMLRLIEDVNRDNLGVNLDTANLILYGKANTVDSLDVFGKHVKNLHAKDGLYPTNGRQLGKEVRLGDGKANMPELLRKLKQLDFQGEIIIEREISGEQQRQDIIYTKQYLENLIEEL